MIIYRSSNEFYRDAITFDTDDLPTMIKAFQRALNCWSNPPQELIDILDQMKAKP
jgi:hypothetical protein